MCAFERPFIDNGERLRFHYMPSLMPNCLCECADLSLSVSMLKNKRGKVEESQRKVGVILLNGQKLELSCDVKAVCKDVLDMVIAHVGLVEHHLFSLAYLKG